MEERLQKIIAQWGIASRREAEEMIKESRVCVNGIMAHLGQKVDPQRDIISIDGKQVFTTPPPPLMYILLHKPLGVVSTCDDPQGRQTVLHLLPSKLQQGSGIHPVGRLDVNSTGALILTNDGELTFALTHPRHSISKSYQVVVEGHPTTAVIEQWSNGVLLDGKMTRPAQVNFVKVRGNHSYLEIILQEGRNRQIRRVAEQLGYPVIKLHRTAIGPIKLHIPHTPPLKVGEYRYLTSAEITFLKQHISHTLVHSKSEKFN